MTDEVFEAFLGSPEERRQAIQVNTYGGHPVACAAGQANLRILLEEDLTGNSREVGAYLKHRLEGLMDRHRVIGEVRGRGLLVGVELVRDRETREPVSEAFMGRVVAETQKRGVIVGRSTFSARFLGNTVNLSPPLCLTRDEADRIVAAIDGALGELHP